MFFFSDHLEDLLIAAQCGVMLLLTLLLLAQARRVNRRANYWLAAFVAVIGCFLLGELLLAAPVGYTLTTAVIVRDAALLLVPALFVYAVTSFARPRWWPTGVHLLLLLPALLQLLLELTLLRGVDPDTTALTWVRPLMFAERLAFVALAVGCWAYSYRLLRRHKRSVERVRGDAEVADLRWMTRVLLAVAVLVGFQVLGVVADEQSWFALAEQLTLLAVCCYLGVVATTQVEIYPFTQEVVALAQVPGEVEERGRAATVVPASEQLTALRSALATHMTRHRPYLQTDLSLPALAEALGTRPQLLSEAINHGDGQNFYGFVTAYRVAEAKRLLLDPDNDQLTMVAIAERAGFRSKTTFNTRFKEETGQSPTVFRRSERAKYVRLEPGEQPASPRPQ